MSLDIAVLKVIKIHQDQDKSLFRVDLCLINYEDSVPIRRKSQTQRNNTSGEETVGVMMSYFFCHILATYRHFLNHQNKTPKSKKIPTLMYL